jgi:hypothetical protein
MNGIKRILLVTGSAVALIVAGLVVYFLVARPSLISLILCAMVMPVSLILGFGLFKAARDSS